MPRASKVVDEENDDCDDLGRRGEISISCKKRRREIEKAPQRDTEIFLFAWRAGAVLFRSYRI